MDDFLVLVLIAAGIALIAAFYLRSKGYAFARSFITWFLASAGILALFLKLARDYF